jgi:hypothetical protein
MENLAFLKDAFNLATGRTTIRPEDNADWWWAESCRPMFQYLVDEFDFELEAVNLHFRGSAIWYRSPIFGVSIKYQPDIRDMSAEFVVLAELDLDHPRCLDAAALLQQRAPETKWTAPAGIELSHEEITAYFAHLAVGIRLHCSDLLRGEWPADARWTVLW